MKVIKGTSKGFFGNVLDVARHISHSLKNNTPWYINWDSTPYNDITKESNAWEYFFNNNTDYTSAAELVQDYTSLELIEGLNFRQTMNYILSNYITVNSNTQNIINDTAERYNIDSTTLGLHIRKTDKTTGHLFGEPQSALPLDVSVYIKYIDNILPNFQKLYIASDDIDDLTTITDHVRQHHSNKKVIYLDAFRSRGAVSIHNNYSNISGYRKGLEVLVDCCMLSRCGYLIRSTSNIGSTAQFLNLNLTHTNINEIELGDNRETEYNL
jgi:hypothetical protein